MLSNDIRKIVLQLVYESQSGHIGGSFSVADSIAGIFNAYDVPYGDKLILSKGHAVPALYAALYLKGILKDEDLKGFRKVGNSKTRLQGHPDKVLLPEVTATTGSLGQGLSIAIGHALMTTNKVFCIIGDGELQEGQNWEALMFAGNKKLKNLICVLDNNGAQNDGYTDSIMSLGDIEAKVRSFGWTPVTVDSHDDMTNFFRSLVNELKPTFVIVNSTKGKGVSFMENPVWHSKAPNTEEYNKALGELA